MHCRFHRHNPTLSCFGDGFCPSPSFHGDTATSIHNTEPSYDRLQEHVADRHTCDALTPGDWIDYPPFRWDKPLGGDKDEDGRESQNEYVLECFCKRVQFFIYSNPLDVKICHCDMCKKLHGAPMQSAAIFYKTDVRLAIGEVGDINFFSPSLPDPHMTPYATPCPRKIYCAHCGCPLADEGRNMFMVFPSSLHQSKSLEAVAPEQVEQSQPQRGTGTLPPTFNVRKHIFYRKRAFEMWDGIEKWEGLDGKSRRMADDGSVLQ